MKRKKTEVVHINVTVTYESCAYYNQKIMKNKFTMKWQTFSFVDKVDNTKMFFQFLLSFSLIFILVLNVERTSFFLWFNEDTSMKRN